MVAHFTMRTYGVNQAFQFVEGIWLHQKSRQIWFFSENNFSTSYVRNMYWATISYKYRFIQILQCRSYSMVLLLDGISEIGAHVWARTVVFPWVAVFTSNFVVVVALLIVVCAVAVVIDVISTVAVNVKKINVVVVVKLHLLCLLLLLLFLFLEMMLLLLLLIWNMKLWVLLLLVLLQLLFYSSHLLLLLDVAAFVVFWLYYCCRCLYCSN